MVTSTDSLTRQAYVALRQQIVTWQLSPGVEVSEAELAEKLSMSKTPVREALAQLRAEGLVETYPRRGYRVLPVTMADLGEMFEVRILVEGECAGLAAERITDAQLEELDRYADATYSMEEGGSLDEFIKANRAFHSAIAMVTGNSRLHGLVLSQLDNLERVFYLGALARDLNPETQADHRRIVEVLRERKPDAAREVMRQHNRVTQAGIVELISASRSRHIELS